MSPEVLTCERIYIALLPRCESFLKVRLQSCARAAPLQRWEDASARSQARIRIHTRASERALLRLLRLSNPGSTAALPASPGGAL